MLLNLTANCFTPVAMGIAKKEYLIVFCTNSACEPDRALDTNAFLVDIAYDHESLSSKVKARRPKAILVIQNQSTHTGITTQLRETSNLDNIPIFVFGSLEDANKILSSLVLSKA